METLQFTYWRDSIIDAVLAAADPKLSVMHSFQREMNQPPSISELKKKGYSRFHLICIGKAAIPLAEGLIEVFGDELCGGVIVPKASFTITKSDWQSNFTIIPAAHPVPDLHSCDAARAILGYVEPLGEQDFVYYLISGGGSALVTLPEGKISLADLSQLNHLLLESGADINEINCIRKHIDKIKGGKLIARTHPAGFCTLILSDVLGDPVDVIASGPTVFDHSTFLDAMEILEKYKIYDRIPASVRFYIQKGFEGAVEETLKKWQVPEDYIQPIIIGSNRNSLQAASLTANALGLQPVILSDHLIGEAREAGPWMVDRVKSFFETGKHNGWYCFLCGGETTVTIRGKGKGGRNTEMALSAVEALATLKNAYMVTFATDGEDGPTDAAGAWLQSDTLARSLMMGLKIEDFLEQNDSYTYFKNLRQLLVTGSTGTNVNDISFMIVEA
jgi:glycerate 2-kinase